MEKLAMIAAWVHGMLVSQCSAMYTNGDRLTQEEAIKFSRLIWVDLRGIEPLRRWMGIPAAYQIRPDVETGPMNLRPVMLGRSRKGPNFSGHGPFLLRAFDVLPIVHPSWKALFCLIFRKDIPNILADLQISAREGSGTVECRQYDSKIRFLCVSHRRASLGWLDSPQTQ